MICTKMRVYLLVLEHPLDDAHGAGPVEHRTLGRVVHALAGAMRVDAVHPLQGDALVGEGGDGVGLAHRGQQRGDVLPVAAHHVGVALRVQLLEAAHGGVHRRLVPVRAQQVLGRGHEPDGYDGGEVLLVLLQVVEVVDPRHHLGRVQAERDELFAVDALVVDRGVSVAGRLSDGIEAQHHDGFDVCLGGRVDLAELGQTRQRRAERQHHLVQREHSALVEVIHSKNDCCGQYTEKRSKWSITTPAIIVLHRIFSSGVIPERIAKAERNSRESTNLFWET